MTPDAFRNWLADAPRAPGPAPRRTLVMGVLNVTPDSFSDGGQFDTADRAVARAVARVEEGAALIDVGGESPRPGSVPVDSGRQIERIVPVIRAIRDLERQGHPPV